MSLRIDSSTLALYFGATVTCLFFSLFFFFSPACPGMAYSILETTEGEKSEHRKPEKTKHFILAKNSSTFNKVTKQAFIAEEVG